ncbi:MAG TPA: DUF4244 domain-containing protein [Aeromicrobium sp.]|nr:DUF4244 domain-containing protein [Aeromicrobium sp.]
MSTAEYAVGTIAAVCIGCLLVKLSDDPSWLTDVFERLRQVILQVAFRFDRPWL